MAWNLFEFEEELKPKPKAEEQPTCRDFMNWAKDNEKLSKMNLVIKNMVLSRYDNIYPFEKSRWDNELDNVVEQLKSYWEVFKSKEITIATMYICDRYIMIYRPKGDYIVTTTFKDFDDEICFPACAIWWYDEQGNPVDSADYMRLKTFEEQAYVKKLFEKAKEKYGDKYNMNDRDRREYYFHNILHHEEWSKPRLDSVSKNWYSFCSRTASYRDMIAYFQHRNNRVTVTYQFNEQPTNKEIIEKIGEVQKMRKQLMPDNYSYYGCEIKHSNKWELVLTYCDKKYIVNTEDEVDE